MEKIIKSQTRVKEHGEVFTPAGIVNRMLAIPGIKEKVNTLTSTFLEPAAGEGAFLTEILKKKLLVAKKVSNTISEYEENSLIALSSLYGIELLEDNVKILTMNMFSVFYHEYMHVLNDNKRRENKKVLKSAEVIISANMIQGDAITKKGKDGKPLVFSEWLLKKGKRGVHKVQRTEHVLDSIISGSDTEDTFIWNQSPEQLNLFEPEGFTQLTLGQNEPHHYKYVPVKMIDIYKRITEEC